jgi:nitrogen fixation protein NifU and related proteins
MAAVEQMYQEIILDHARRPHGRGLREPGRPGLRAADAHHVNPTCGDEVTVRVQVDGDALVDVSWEGQGCSISQAAASVLTDVVAGRPLSDVLARYDAFHALVTGRGTVERDESVLEDGVAFAGVARYPVRVKCALLPWTALKDAVARAVAAPEEETP